MGLSIPLPSKPKKVALKSEMVNGISVRGHQYEAEDEECAVVTMLFKLGDLNFEGADMKVQWEVLEEAANSALLGSKMVLIEEKRTEHGGYAIFDRIGRSRSKDGSFVYATRMILRPEGLLIFAVASETVEGVREAANRCLPKVKFMKPAFR